MTPILADALSWDQVGVIAAVCGVVVGVITWLTRTTVKVEPQPLTVQIVEELADQFASKREFTAHVAENKKQHEIFFQRFRELENNHNVRIETLSKEWRNWADLKLTELVKSNDEGRQRLHSRVDEVLVKVSELKGEMHSLR
ncbi:MAG: hypothetical protein KGL39_46410 [Patescibacteria group bacterium]|nr:hypothetical protein [Patescibacteria group bacterium]